MNILTQSLAGQVANFGTAPSLAPDAVPVHGDSYVRGPAAPPLEDITVPHLIGRAASRFGPREAVICPHQSIRRSYHDLCRETDALAAGLLAIGLEKGDRVGIWSPNRYEWVLTQLASARIGAILVTINPAYRLAELKFALNRSGCRALVLAESFKSSEYLRMLRQLAPELNRCRPGGLRSEQLPHLRSVIALCDDPGPGIYAFAHVHDLAGPAQVLRLAAVDSTLAPDDAINIQFTSGTTGAPKGATLTHRNIVNNARFVTDRIHLAEDDRLCIPVPLYHCFGMVMGVLGAISKGAAMVFPGEGFDAEATLAAVSNERCSALYGVPTMFVAMLDRLPALDLQLARMRTGIMAGAPCPKVVMDRVLHEMHMPELTICYGMTETSPVSFQSMVDDPVEQRCDTVGRIHPHLEARIVDAGGKVLPVGEEGELCTRGYSTMKGYWDDETATQASVRDGWMHTGDLARLDAEGFCTVTGRIKDMIIRGGENIYPREVEEYLFRHPHVREAHVFGIPDAGYGEEVCAWVIPTTGSELSAEDISSFCQGNIAHYKIPRFVRVVAEVPTTVTGKPQKFRMRQMMIDELSPGDDEARQSALPPP